MGLLVSAVVGNSDRAMAIVPILLIPQLMFAGALVPVERMLGPAKVLAQLMMNKWSLELAGSITHLAPRFEAQYPPGFAAPYANAYDSVSWIQWCALAGFALAMLGGTLLAQKRKDAR